MIVLGNILALPGVAVITFLEWREDRRAKHCAPSTPQPPDAPTWSREWQEYIDTLPDTEAPS